ncbi:MAG TPA: thioredoxin domain-containing protein [Vicinamibacterales bacterium]|nr:thioredoxin domain-containing protein [Vicinamibacterales bacterium]
MPNRLASEHSPYLLQHKDNPVDWRPWGDEAFIVARQQNKPIFLSIGYSTCHWCHVMEHESFENGEVAAILNRDFVSIKVDREERPDVDRVYMTFVQATTGSGGWPMSVWLTPSLRPFYGGTYFPPSSKWGKPGFTDILAEIARVWREEREKVEQSAATITDRLRTIRSHGQRQPIAATTVLARAVEEFAVGFDRRLGGFGTAPKFPRPSELFFLLREFARTGTTEARDMVLVTLRAMALGGIRDHLGGGFHRYSVDAEWRVPHFEKMLYDQAQLVLAYVEAAQLTGDRFFADVATDTLDYVRRDLADPGGGFYSAEDADSVPPEDAHEAHPHKMEGAFYIWREDEIRELLGGDADVFIARYGVRPDGNAPFDPQAEFTHKNLLHAARALEDVAEAAGRSVEEVEQSLQRGRAALMARRSTRPRPHLDDKVLTAWNGLMIAAFARAGRVLDGAEAYLEGAKRAATFIRTHLWNPSTGTLLRRYRKGDAGVEGYAEDYAYLIFGLLELFQSDGDPQWLEWALALQERQDALFWDPIDGGWFSTTGKDESVLLRLKEDYDGAEPAASSVSVLNLLTLAHLVGETGSTPNSNLEPTPNSQERQPTPNSQIELTLGIFSARAAQSGRTVPMMLAALSTYHAGITQIVIAGDRERADTQALLEVVRRRYMPAAIVIPVVPEHREALARRMPWVAHMLEREGRATAYVCRNFACQAPTNIPGELSAQLDAP